MEPTVYHAFAYGLVGSSAVEIILILQAMGPRGAIPGKYKTKLFWIVRIFLAFLAGGIATAYFSPHLPLFLYVHLGAATPAILTRVSQVGYDDADDHAKPK
jgi:hypothetical protein